jgi:hypothetical protein
MGEELPSPPNEKFPLIDFGEANNGRSSRKFFCRLAFSGQIAVFIGHVKMSLRLA